MDLILYAMFLSRSGTFFNVKRTFEDVYGTENTPTNYTGTEYTQTLTTEEENVYVHNCVFIGCSSDSFGGALSCAVFLCKQLLVEQSSFISCRASEMGGGIFFYNDGAGQCVLCRICGFKCSAAYGQFAYLTSGGNLIYKNHVNYSTITHTSNEGTDSSSTLVIFSGKILCPSVNITNNKCDQNSALLCFSLREVTSYISYSSIVNNSCKQNCIYLTGSETSHCINTCNILGNSQTSSDQATIIAEGTSVLIEDSCILGNNKGNKVFYTDTATITISNCTIDDDIFTGSRYSGDVTISKTLEITFINALTHIVTQSCDSYFDSYGTLTVKPVPTPDITPVETPDITPVETPDITPVETPDITPVETPDITPVETPDRTPVETPDRTPVETPDRTPVEKPDRTPVETPDRTPVETTETNETNKINEANELSGISSGVVAAIVIACIVVVAAVIFSIYWFLFRNKEKDENIEI